jgi:hypothetical protein
MKGNKMQSRKEMAERKRREEEEETMKLEEAKLAMKLETAETNLDSSYNDPLSWLQVDATPPCSL